MAAQDQGDLDDAIRRGAGTWAVSDYQLPAVAHFLHDILPNEPYDPHFFGQWMETTYFDTEDFVLRRARRKGQMYLVLRLRCYQDDQGSEIYLLSGKTESEKWRQQIDARTAEAIGADPDALVPFLPPNLLARFQGLVGEEQLVGVVKVCCRRYAVESRADRYTLDVGVATDTGKRLGMNVLEFKSTDSSAQPPGNLLAIGLRPVKLSKFLWATAWR